MEYRAVSRSDPTRKANSRARPPGARPALRPAGRPVRARSRSRVLTLPAHSAVRPGRLRRCVGVRLVRRPRQGLSPGPQPREPVGRGVRALLWAAAATATQATNSDASHSATPSNAFSSTTGPSVTYSLLIHPPDVRNVSNTTSSTNNLTYKSDDKHDAQRVPRIDTLQSRTIENERGIAFTQSLLWKLVPWVASATVVVFLSFLFTVGLIVRCCSGRAGPRPVDGDQPLPNSNTRLLQLSLAHEGQPEVESADITGTNRNESIVRTPSESIANFTGSYKALKWQHDAEEDSFMTETSLSDAPSEGPCRSFASDHTDQSIGHDSQQTASTCQ